MGRAAGVDRRLVADRPRRRHLRLPADGLGVPRRRHAHGDGDPEPHRRPHRGRVRRPLRPALGDDLRATSGRRSSSRSSRSCIGVDSALLFVAILINAGVKQFFDPAYEALIPEIASDDELTAANAFLSDRLVRLDRDRVRRRPACSPRRSASAGRSGSTALTFLFSAACIFFLRVRSKLEVATRTTSVSVVVDEPQAGHPDDRRHADAAQRCSCSARRCSSRSACGTCCCCRWRSSELGATEFEYGLQEALTSVGFVVGRAVHGHVRDRLPDGPVGVHRHLGMGIAGVLYGLSPTIGIAIFWVMLTGFFNSPSSVAPADAAPAQHAARAAGPGVLRRCSSCATSSSSLGHGRRRARRHHRRPDHAHLRVADPVRRRRSPRCSSPGIGRPAAEWRRGLDRPARGTAVPPRTATRPAGDRSRLRRAGRPRGDVRPLNGAQRAAFLARCRRCARWPRARGSSAQGDEATTAYFILEGEAAAGIPERRRRLSRPVDDGRGRLLRRDRRAHREHPDGRRRRDPADDALEVPAETLRAAMEVPEVNKLHDLDAHRAAAAEQPAGPAAPRLDGPGRAARPAHQGADGRGAAQGLRGEG